MSIRRVLIIGIGTGDPKHLTVQAIDALNEVDVFFVMDKGAEKAELVRVRKEICARYAKSRPYRFVEAEDPVRDPTTEAYDARVAAWHAERVAIYERMIERELAPGACGAFLVWGDPSLYDSTLRIIDQVVARSLVPFAFEVIPGISSVQVLAARHKIALNRIGGAVHVTTGRRLADRGTGDHDDIVVMLDGHCTFREVPPEDVEIYWGAYLGSESELLVAGKLADVADEIVRLRSEARRQHGWIMDTYLLRKRVPE